MNNIDDDDLSKFTAAPEDRVKPIDLVPAPAAAPKPPGVRNPVPDDLGAPIDAAPAAPTPEPAATNPSARSQGRPEPADTTPADDKINIISRGEYVDLIEKEPTLKRILIGAGWDNRSFEGDVVDVDISLFMLDKKNQTRIDEDFIFYNNERACEGAVHHMGDSRSGAGDGDDENIFIDLNGLPFDILKIVFALSIYDPEIKGHTFSMVKNVYIRIANKDDGQEIFRYKLDAEEHRGGNAMIVGTLIREGPRWIYEASLQLMNGGLAKIATDYGIIVKELQSTGEDVSLPDE